MGTIPEPLSTPEVAVIVRWLAIHAPTLPDQMARDVALALTVETDPDDLAALVARLADRLGDRS